MHESLYEGLGGNGTEASSSVRIGFNRLMWTLIGVGTLSILVNLVALGWMAHSHTINSATRMLDQTPATMHNVTLAIQSMSNVMVELCKALVPILAPGHPIKCG